MKHRILCFASAIFAVFQGASLSASKIDIGFAPSEQYTIAHLEKKVKDLTFENRELTTAMSQCKNALTACSKDFLTKTKP
jgi:hypothetical protein